MHLSLFQSLLQLMILLLKHVVKVFDSLDPIADRVRAVKFLDEGLELLLNFFHVISHNGSTLLETKHHLGALT
jgi:hypothetical protein